jgi:hypothetical protein
MRISISLLKSQPPRWAALKSSGEATELSVLLLPQTRLCPSIVQEERKEQKISH